MAKKITVEGRWDNFVGGRILNFVFHIWGMGYGRRSVHRASRHGRYVGCRGRGANNLQVIVGRHKTLRCMFFLSCKIINGQDPCPLANPAGYQFSKSLPNDPFGPHLPQFLHISPPPFPLPHDFTCFTVFLLFLWPLGMLVGEWGIPQVLFFWYHF